MTVMHVKLLFYTVFVHKKLKSLDFLWKFCLIESEQLTRLNVFSHQPCK